MNPQDIFTQLDEAQKHLRTSMALSDLLSCMTADPPLEGTIQETGSFLVLSIQQCIQILESIRSSYTSILEGEYPNADLSDHQ